MKQVSNKHLRKKTLGTFAAYYFCLNADTVHEFDAKFQPFMDVSLKGGSTDKFDTSDEESVSSSVSSRPNKKSK